MKGAARKERSADPGLGSVGPYKLDAIIRGGGSWTTFAGVHRTVGHTVWLTMAPPSIQPSSATTERLIGAATILSKLGFEAVLGLRDVLEDAGRTVVITEAPNGPSMREMMERTREARDLSVEHRAALAWLLARAVATVHDGGVVHGAVSPENAFVSDRGSVRLGGFWDARAVGQESPVGDRDVPNAGPEERYRSPERIGGSPGDRAADVFSIGVVAYELVTGRHPFDEDRQGESLARRIRAADAPPSDAPREIDEVLRKCLQKVPSLRYETAHRLADDLATALGGARRASDLARALLARSKGRPEVPVAPAAGSGVSRLGKQLAIVAGLMVLVGLWVVAGDERFSTSKARKPGVSSAQVRVLARPWADVYVDGERVDTTPIGSPLVVTPGRHEIVLRHPRAPDERRVLDLASGETATVDVEMDVKRPVVDAGVDETP